MHRALSSCSSYQTYNTLACIYLLTTTTTSAASLTATTSFKARGQVCGALCKTKKSNNAAAAIRPRPLLRRRLRQRLRCRVPKSALNFDFIWRLTYLTTKAEPVRRRPSADDNNRDAPRRRRRRRRCSSVTQLSDAALRQQQSVCVRERERESAC